MTSFYNLKESYKIGPSNQNLKEKNLLISTYTFLWSTGLANGNESSEIHSSVSNLSQS